MPEITAQEAADFLGVSRRYVAKLVERGELPGRKAGNYPNAPLQIPRAAVEAYQKKRARKLAERSNR